jgi:hypothetical protein
MEKTVLEESWRRNGPVSPSLEVIDDDDDEEEEEEINGIILIVSALPL